jgi:hypothetical protein
VAVNRAVVGTSMAKSVGGSERKGPIDGPHGSERAGERTGFCAGERDPRNNERGQVRVDGFGADKSSPPHSEREREKGERARDDADRRGPPARGGRTRGRGCEAGPAGLAGPFPFTGIF